MAEIHPNIERANSLQREIDRALAARKRLDDAILRRQDALRRLATPPALRVPASPPLR
jgi:hypothetical protein